MCYGQLEADGTCSCGYAVPKRQAKASKDAPKGPLTCDCGELAVIGNQCRQHAGMAGYVGNQLSGDAAIAKLEGERAIAKWHQDLTKYREKGGDYPLPPDVPGITLFCHQYHRRTAEAIARGRRSVMAPANRDAKLPRPPAMEREPGGDC